MSNPAASVVIVSRDKLDYLQVTLQSLNHQDTGSVPWEIVVVDDGSKQEVAPILEDICLQVPFQLHRQEATGIASARNLGIRHAKGNVIILADDDVVFGPNYLKQHLCQHEKHGRSIAVVSDRHNAYLSKVWSRRSMPVIEAAIRGRTEELELRSRRDPYAKRTLRLFDRHPFGEPAPWICFVGKSSSVRKEDIEAVGYFDENFTGWGFEDVELGYRLFRKGVRFVYNSSSTVFHLEHPVPSNRGNDLRRSLTYFVQKHSDSSVRTFADFIDGRIDLDHIQP